SGGLAVDSKGNLYVADELNNRVTEYSSPLNTFVSSGKRFNFSAVRSIGGAISGADRNFGNCNGSQNADTLCQPARVAVDSGDNVYIADRGNSRVLYYLNPTAPGGGTPGVPAAAGDVTADQVFGQGGSFTSGVC